MRKRLARFFTEEIFTTEDIFKDKEGRFKTRWHASDKPNITINKPNDVPTYQATIDFPVNKKRVFDFDLPKDFSSIEPPMQIWAMGEGMFSVNNIWIPGPIIIFPTAVFMWNAPRLEDLEDHHLDILKLIQPRLDYAVLGTGRGKVLNFAEGVRKRFRGIGINLDLCPTFEACSTFNLAAEEGRRICGLILPHNYE